MKKLFSLVLAATAMSGAFADCYKMDNSTGNATIGRDYHIDSTDRFIIYCGTVNIAEGGYVRSGGNSSGACNFIGVDRGAASTLNINGGTFWCASSKGAGVLGVGNNNNGVQATVNINSGELLVDTMLRMSTMWSGTTGATSSGTVNVNGGEVTVKEFYIGASSSSSGTAILNLAGGITRTQKITFPAYNGQAFKFNGGILEAQAANIFNVANYAGSKTRTLEVVNGRTSLFRTGGFNQTIPAMTGTGFLRLTGGGTVTFAEKELTYGLILDGVGIDLGTLDAGTPALSAAKLVEFRSPLTLKVTLPANPAGKYPLIANCETVTAAGVMANTTVVGGGAGKLIYQGGTIYLDFGNESSDGLVLADAAGGALTPDASTYASILFEKTAGAYILGGTGLTLTHGVADGAPGRQTITAPVDVTTAAETFFVEEGSTLEFAGGLTVPNLMVKDGKGTLSLSHSTRPGKILMREGVLDFGGGTYTSVLDIWPDRRHYGTEVALTNGVYRPTADTHVYYGDATLKILDGFTLDLRARDNSRMAIGYQQVYDTDKISKVVIDGGTFYTAGNQAGNCNFINPDHSGTGELILNRGAFYATTANGGTLRIAIGSNRNTIGYLRINGGHFELGRDLTMATAYNSTGSGAGRAFFEQTGGVAQISYFYLGASNSGTGEGTVTLTGGELKVRMLKCWQYNKQTLVCDGAKITALQNDSDSIPFMTQLGNGDGYARSYTIGANGLEINTAGFTVRDDLPFAGTGGMSVTGAGTFNLNCVHTFGGVFAVGAGTTVNLKKMRTFHSGVTLGENARLKVAASADEATTVAGALTLGAGAKLVFDLEAADSPSTTFTADGGFTLPEGATDVLDFVDVTDATKYEASVNGNSIMVHLKDLTIPTEAVWTGAGEAGNLADPNNWTCRNATGAELAGKIPTDATTIHIPAGTTAFTMPTGATLARKAIVFGGAAHRATQMGRITYGSRGTMNNTSWANIALADYMTYSETGIDNLNGLNTTWQANLGQSQLRFEGWFYVPAAKAGVWSILQSFDDYFAFYIDGTQIIANPTYQCSNSATCGVSEGWHRFKIICGDTSGGKGSQLDFNGTKVPMKISCNGSDFALTDLTLGTDANTITLTADCDWRGLGAIPMTEALVIDLAGHKLAIDGFTTDGIIGARFVNSATDTTAELTVDVAEGTTLNNYEVMFDGNLKFIKAGAGEYGAARCQNYNGGTVVAGGTLKMLKTGSMPGTPVFGPNTSTFRNMITVNQGAVLDINSGTTAWGYHGVNLDGGTIRGTSLQPNFVFQVTKDSTVDSQAYNAQTGDGNDGSRGINPSLNGNTLTLKTGTSGSPFHVCGATGPGTLDAAVGGWLYFKYAITPADPNARVSLIDTGMAMQVLAAIDVKDYYAGYGAAYMQGTGKMRVFGTFTPAAAGMFYGCEMQDGSTIDLSGKSDPWSVTRTVTGSSVSGNGTVTFAEGATVKVDIHGRGVHSGEKIIAWTEAPNARFVPDSVSKAAGRAFYMKEDGLYVLSGMMIYIR